MIYYLDLLVDILVSMGDKFKVRVSMGDRFRVRVSMRDRFRARLSVEIDLGLR